MWLARTIVIALACLIAAVPFANAGPARFWVSESSTVPGVPGSLTVNAPIGSAKTLYIWAQPATDGGGVFRKLESFTLDLVSLNTSLQPEPAPFIDFVDGTFKVENVTGSQQRFQYVTDSYRDTAQGGPLLSEKLPGNIGPASPDAVKGLQGVSPFANPPAVGIGHASEPFPFRVGSGSSAAWRVGEFAIEALQSSGTNDLFLQVGFQGMRHQGDVVPLECTTQPQCATGTEVSFGGSSQTYNAHNVSHRQRTLSGDTYDVRVNAIAGVWGDYDGNGGIGPEDYNAWSTAFGQSVSPFGNGADGNRNGIVDAADYVMWQKYQPLAGGSIAPIGDSTGGVPEPATIALLAILIVPTLLTRSRLRHR